MAYKCFACGKAPVAGKTVSHSHRATNRRFEPNLQHVRIKVGNTKRREFVCTTCLVSGKVQKTI